MMYRFVDCQLDARLYEFHRAGQTLKLEPKVFDMLAYVIEYRDRVVSKQELLDSLWPEQFISDATFDHCIMAARKAIGDDGRRQEVIKTIRGRGYRFVAPVEEAADEVTPEVTPVPLQTPPEAPGVDYIHCPQCQQRHPSGAKFCSECGVSLRVICLRCQGENLPGGKFCIACGHTLSRVTPALAGDGEPVPLAYTPKHLADQILTTRSALEGERKQVTVLFCDLDDSMVLAQHLGPEGMHTLLQRFFELALQAIHAYGGTVNQFLGDGFMALFGAPLAQEDHARRGVLAALQLRRSLQEHAVEFAQLLAGSMREPPLQVRVCLGLNTGMVVVGSIGDNLRMDYTAVGDTTNLAARLQQLAEPDAILVSETTAKLVQGEVRIEALGAVAVRGKAEPVTVYNIVGQGAQRSLLGTRPVRVLSRFAGRERELQTLSTILAQVETGQGQVVGLVGEAGIGKSRLLYEFRQSLAAKQITYLDGRCASYGGMIPYLPVRDMLRYYCGISEAESPASVAEQVQQRFGEAGLGPDEEVIYLYHLLGLKEGSERLAGLSSEAIKGRLFAALRRMILQGSRQQPVIILIEDLHWIDQSSEDFLVSLIEALGRDPVLLLTTYRPGYRPPWIGKSYVTQMALQRLAPGESLTIVYSVLQQQALPHSLAQMILARADGNPLFLEELTRAIEEQDTLPAGANVPDTIQGVLSARIDRLPDPVKRLLQTASVLGRAFSACWLRAIWEGPDDLETGLRELKRLEFLYEENVTEEPSYVFKHTLIQEVAYDSLLTLRQRSLHAAVGQALEHFYAGRLADAYDRLAYHYARAQRPDKAVTYLGRFAEKAAAAHAHVEAVVALREALDQAAKLPADTERQRLRLDLQLRLALSLSALGRDREVLERLQQQQEALNRLQDTRLAGRYALLCSQTYSNLGDWPQAAHQAQEAMAAATSCHDNLTLGQAYHVLAMERYWTGHPRQGVEYAQQALVVFAETGEAYRLGMAHFVLGLNALLLGEFECALQAATQAGAIGEALADARLQTFAAWTTGWIQVTRGDWEAGMVACQHALEASSDPLNTAFAMGWLGYAYLEKGDASAALTPLQQAVQRLHQFRYRRLEGLYTTFLSAAYLAQGQLDTARDLALRSLHLARQESYHVGMAWAQRTLGQVEQANGALSEAERHFQEALTTFAALPARFEVGRTHLVLAELAHRRGNREAMTLHVTEAYHLFTVLQVPAYIERATQCAHALGLAFAEPVTDGLA